NRGTPCEKGFKHFVDKHRIKLIEKVSNIPAILDELLRENVIQEDSYDKIRALPTSQEKMKELFSGPLEASGVQGKEMFYKILNKHESYLINDLETTEVPVIGEYN
uniref:CARD domain-containing protein n=1 Tax=Sander lucioperca TaxID=283035 RepID=A0A8C9Y484_SANLU